MTRICLDTSAYSHFCRGLPDAVETIRRAHSVMFPVVALGELRAGFSLGSKPTENEGRLQRFLGNPAIRVLEVDDEAAWLYADIFVALRQAGTPVPTNDIWIAALACREGAIVLTADSHFRLIQRIGCRVLREDHG